MKKCIYCVCVHIKICDLLSINLAKTRYLCEPSSESDDNDDDDDAERYMCMYVYTQLIVIVL